MFNKIGEFLNSFQNIFRIPELRKRLLFSLGLLVVYRLGGHIPIPGSTARRSRPWSHQASGGALRPLRHVRGRQPRQGHHLCPGHHAVHLAPPSSSSCFGAVIPYFEKLQKEGEEGRKKINQYTRYGTVVLAAIEAFGVAIFLQNSGFTGPGGEAIVPHPGIGFLLLTIITLTAGTHVRHVAGRADHRARHRQRHLAHHLHRDRGPLPAGHSQYRPVARS